MRLAETKFRQLVYAKVGIMEKNFKGRRTDGTVKGGKLQAER